MKVSKRTVEQIVVEFGGEAFPLEPYEADDLWRKLAEALGKPLVEHRGCGDRYSHGPHAHGKGDLLYCTGRSFDAT